MKKLLLLNFYALVCFSTQTAFTQTKPKELSPAIIDSSILIDTPEKSVNTDNGFNNLFDKTGASTQSGPSLNPQAISFVKDYIDENGKDLSSIKSWALPYFNMMDKILAENGLPTELKYLAVIESRLKSSAKSWAGAVGPWQFMPATARTLGLCVTRKVDERKNYVKSTKAAARYLKDLYAIYGDWLLVIAAYNGGAGNVNKAIRKAHSVNFWTLQYYLPAESRTHVKKFIGTHYIFEGQGGLTTLTKAEVSEQYGADGYMASRKISNEELQACKTLTVAGKYYSGIIAKYVNMEANDFNRYNPAFDKVMASTSNSYDMKLPEEKMELFVANKYQILNESVQQLLNGSSQASASTTVSAPLAVEKKEVATRSMK